MIKFRIFGDSPQIRRVIEMVAEVSHSDIPVLITGEIGSGKELVARNIHYNGMHHRKPFFAIHCASIPGKFLDSIFDYNGTVFLDEIADLEPSLQSKLLRMLQEREFELNEDDDKKKSDFRLISTTSHDLKKEINAGTFRKDLLDMINVVQIDVPPLRSRREDIPLLARHFLKLICTREKKKLIISDEVMEIFMHYSWPGNMRHLKNVIERAVVLAKGDTITTKELPEELTATPIQAESPHKMTLKDLKIQAIKETLHSCKGNKTKAASILGISRKALYKRLKEYKLM